MNSYFTKVKKTEINSFYDYTFLAKYFENLGMDCIPGKGYEVDKNEILNLVDICGQVLSNHSLADKLLPIMCDYYLTNEEKYGKEYFEAVEHVKNAIEADVLPEFDKLGFGEGIEFNIDF